MTLKHFIKTFKKNVSFRKKVLLFGGLGVLVLVGGVIAANSDSMFASVLNLNQQAQQRKLNFSQKPGNKQNTCVDTDGGKNYYEKGIITTLINGYQRVEQDYCNANGTLRERFCGNPGEIAGLLRSENYVQCEHGCFDGACIQATTGNIIRDIAIQSGEFVAINSIEAEFRVHVKNIGNVAMPIDGFGHDLFLDANSFVAMGGNYTVQTITNPNTMLQPNETYTFSAIMRLQNNHQFTYDSKINVSVSTYPETDDNMVNNNYTLYMTGNLTNTGSVNGIGDVIIENMYITPSNTPTVGTNNDTNKINLVIKNIGNGDIHIPYSNGGYRFSFICYYPEGNGGFGSIEVQQSILSPGESYITQLHQRGNDHSNWFSTLGSTSIQCVITSQQQQGRTTTNPNSTQIIHESDGTNNSFTLNYEVISSKQPTPSLRERLRK